MQWQQHPFLALTATGKQQELPCDALKRIEICFGLRAIALHGQAQAQPRDRALEVVGDASEHRGPLFFAALQPRQHRVEALTQALHLSGSLLGNRGWTLFQAHPGQGPLQPA